VEKYLEPDRQQMTIWRICIACWIPKATNTHSEYVIINDFSTATMVARTHLSFSFYIHCLSCLSVKPAPTCIDHKDLRLSLIFPNMLIFYGKDLLALRPAIRMEDRPLKSDEMGQVCGTHMGEERNTYKVLAGRFEG
jgi:hypothetical protein